MYAFPGCRHIRRPIITLTTTHAPNSCRPFRTDTSHMATIPATIIITQWPPPRLPTPQATTTTSVLTCITITMRPTIIITNRRQPIITCICPTSATSPLRPCPPACPTSRWAATTLSIFISSNNFSIRIINRPTVRRHIWSNCRAEDCPTNCSTHRSVLATVTSRQWAP